MEMNTAILMIGEYQKYIEKDFPDFKITQMQYLGSGWDNAAFLVNGEYVFRFLRGIFDRSYPLKTDDIKKEVNILKYMHDKVNFSIPRPDFIGRYYSYFGYKMIPGTLWDKAESPLSDEYLMSWVRTRSAVSKAIIPADANALKILYYRTDKNEQFVNQFIASDEYDPRIKQMAKDAMAYVISRCQDKSNWVFVHEDMQMSNCLVDENKKEIVGVIDWLEAEIAPVEAEFYFWSKYGRETLEKVAKMQEQYDGTVIDTSLAVAIHQFYIVADYVDFKNREFEESAQRKLEQIEAYL